MIAPGPFSVSLGVLRRLFTTDVVEPSVLEWGLVPGSSVRLSTPCLDDVYL